jgi:hypothetical protein
VEDYVSFFKGLKPDGQLVVAALSGPVVDPVEVTLVQGNPELAPSCESSMGRGVPAIRIKTFVDSFSASGQYNVGANICQPDFSTALERLGTRIAGQLGLRCLDSVADSDTSTPEVDPECTVTLHTNTSEPVRECNTAAGGCDPCPCWRMRPHQQCEGLGSGIAVELSSASSLPEDGVIEVNCKK